MSSGPQTPDESSSQVVLPIDQRALMDENDQLLRDIAHANTAEEIQRNIDALTQRSRLVVQLQNATQYVNYDLLRSELEKMTQLTQEQMTELVRNVVDIMDPSIPPENKPKNETAKIIIDNIPVQPIADYVPWRTPDPTDRTWRTYIGYKEWDDMKERLHPHESDGDEM